MYKNKQTNIVKTSNTHTISNMQTHNIQIEISTHTYNFKSIYKNKKRDIAKTIHK